MSINFASIMIDIQRTFKGYIKPAPSLRTGILYWSNFYKCVLYFSCFFFINCLWFWNQFLIDLCVIPVLFTNSSFCDPVMKRCLSKTDFRSSRFLSDIVVLMRPLKVPKTLPLSSFEVFGWFCGWFCGGCNRWSVTGMFSIVVGRFWGGRGGAMVNGLWWGKWSVVDIMNSSSFASDSLCGGMLCSRVGLKTVLKC